VSVVADALTARGPLFAGHDEFGHGGVGTSGDETGEQINGTVERHGVHPSHKSVFFDLFSAFPERSLDVLEDRMRHRMRTSSVRVAVIGAGGISRAHTKAFALFGERIRLVAVADTAVSAARSLAAEHGPEVAAFPDHRELLARAKPEAVVITLPHYLHHPVAREFLEAGVSVLVEKPATTTSSELRDLHALASRLGLVLMAGQMRRFGPAVRHVKTWRDAWPGNFGELRSFDVVVQVNVDAYTGGRPGHWILDGRKAGGGAVVSFGIHRLDLVRFLGGADFSEVTAVGRFDVPFVNGAESQASVLFRMSNGATGTLHANGRAPRIGYMDSFTLHGTHGSIMEVGGPLRYATASGAVTNQWGHQHEGWVDAPDSSDPRDDAFVQQLLAFADAVRSGRPPVANTASENFNTIACMDAIAESLRTAATVKVETL
jgi:predicted dehydrogenase